MAIYHGPDGEVHASLLSEDVVVDSVGTVGRAGEWLVIQPNGHKDLCLDVAFRGQFFQKYPRAVDAEPIPLTSPRRAG
jgi:hypothetical protein